MADSLARLVVTLEAQTASYQRGMENANNQLAKFRRDTDTHLTSMRGAFERFSGGAERALSFFTKFALGGGVAYGLAGLVHHLTMLGEKMQGTNPEAKLFVDQMGRLRGVVDEAFVGVFSALGPAMKTIADGAVAAAKGVKDLQQALKDIEEQRKKNPPAGTGDWRDMFGTGGDPFNPYTRAPPAPQPPRKWASGPLANFLAPGRFDTEMEMSVIQQFYKDQETAQKKAKEAADAQVAAEKKVAQELVEQQKAYDNRLRAQQHGYDMEEAYAEEMKQTFANIDEGIDKALAIGTGKTTEKLQELDVAAEKFGDLFANVLIQSNRDGMKQVLADFLQTLAIMALRAQAVRLFQAAESSGGWFGGALTAIFGRAMGGPVAAGVPYMVGERGPEMFIPSGSGSISPNRGGVTNINVDARNATDPAMVMASVRIAVAQATARAKDDRRRGR